MSKTGNYLGGNTIIRVHRKQSHASKVREKRIKKSQARLAQELASYRKLMEKLPVQIASASVTPPSKTGAKRAAKIVNNLRPVIDQLRNYAAQFSEISGSPSAALHDLAIFELQSRDNVIGVRRSHAGFDGWRKKTRIRALAGLKPVSTEEAVAMPITIEGLEREWDELHLVLFDHTYLPDSAHRVNKEELCAVMRKLGWKDNSPTFALPLSILINLAVDRNKAPNSPITEVSAKSKARYFRPKRKVQKKKQ